MRHRVNVRGERMLKSALLEAIGDLCSLLANAPSKTRRTWRRHQTRDLLKAQRLAARIHDGDEVLDIGCGSGHTLAEVSLFRAIRPRGVDVALRGQRFEEIPIARYDGRTLPFDDKSFDVTLLCYVLHHLSPEHAAVLFGEAVRVTRRRIVMLEDSLPMFGWLYRLRNRCHRLEAGMTYQAATAVYRSPPDEAMFLTHDGWCRWLGAQPGVADVRVESLAEISRFDHHTLFDVALAAR